MLRSKSLLHRDTVYNPSRVTALQRFLTSNPYQKFLPALYTYEPPDRSRRPWLWRRKCRKTPRPHHVHHRRSYKHSALSRLSVSSLRLPQGCSYGPHHHFHIFWLPSHQAQYLRQSQCAQRSLFSFRDQINRTLGILEWSDEMRKAIRLRGNIWKQVISVIRITFMKDCTSSETFM